MKRLALVLVAVLVLALTVSAMAETVTQKTSVLIVSETDRTTTDQEVGTHQSFAAFKVGKTTFNLRKELQEIVDEESTPGHIIIKNVTIICMRSLDGDPIASKYGLKGTVVKLNVAWSSKSKSHNWKQVKVVLLNPSFRVDEIYSALHETCGYIIEFLTDGTRPPR